MNVRGIDISNNNAAVNIDKLKEDNIEIVYLKATEGKTFRDKTMAGYHSKCKQNGLKTGAYHFLVSTSSPEDQAVNFYNMIKDYEWDCIPMLDVETNFSGLSQYVIRFIKTFRQLSPLTLGIYSYTGFLPALRDAADFIKDMPFWEANYNNNPWKLPNNFFNNRVGHQYAEKGVVVGVTGYCDVNYFNEGVLLSSQTIPGEWIEKEGKWWYKHNDGSYTTNGWEKIKDKWYFFDSEGWMAYDWKKDGNTWYYLGESQDGAMKTGWVLIDGKWYYFDENGGMVTGWIKLGDDWFFLKEDGAMATGWIEYEGDDYLLYSSGEMAHDCDYLGYHFDSKGVAKKI